MTKTESQKLLEAVERLVSDDLCEDLEFAVIKKRVTSLEGIKAIQRLKEIYKLVHSRMPHPCSHEVWKEGTEKLLKPTSL